MTQKMKSATRKMAKRARSVRNVSSRPMRRRNSSPSSDSTLFGMPMWAVASIGIAAVSGVMFALMKLDSVRLMMTPVIHDVGEFFGLTEDNGIDTQNITHDRIYKSTIRS